MLTTNGSVIYSDPFSSFKLAYDGEAFGAKIHRESKVASRVSYADIIIHSFKASSTVSDSELRTMAEIKMYEEAGLDLQKQYKILHIKKELEGSESILVEAFAIEEQKTRTTLQRTLKEEKYIDFLALPFLVFSTLYTHKILAPKNDLFVYLSEQEAFVALYRNGRYISTKSLITLAEVLKKLKSENIDLSVASLEVHLQEKGLDADAYSENEIGIFTALQSIFVGIFTKINDIVMYNRNIFGFEHIDRIFMNTLNGRIKGLKNFLDAFGYTDVKLHDFNMLDQAKNNQSFNSIVSLYAYEQLFLTKSNENITFFTRPPQFLSTHNGKLVLVASVATALFSLYPLYVYWNIGIIEQESSLLLEQYEAGKKNVASLNAQLAKLKGDLKTAYTHKAEKDKTIVMIDQSIDELYDMKQASMSYVDFMIKVNQLLKKYGLMVHSIEQKGTTKMSIEVIAKSQERDSIAKFMESLLQEGFTSVTTDEVRSEKLVYVSKIEIVR